MPFHFTMDTTQFEILVDLITKNSPADQQPFLQCMCRTVDLKGSIFRLLSGINRIPQLELKQKTFVLALDLILTRGVRELSLTWDELLSLHAELFRYQHSLGEFEAYLKLEQVFSNIYVSVGDKAQLQELNNALNFSVTSNSVIALAVLSRYHFSAIARAMELISSDSQQPLKVLALSMVVRHVNRGLIPAAYSKLVTFDMAVATMEGLLKSSHADKIEIVLHLLASLQEAFPQEDGPKLVAHFIRSGEVLQALDKGSDRQAELVADVMVALRPTDVYEPFSVGKQLSSLLIVGAKRINDYHSSYCQKVVEFARKRSMDPLFRVTLQGMLVTAPMYATALHIAVKCDLITEYLDLFYPVFPQQDFLMAICKGVLFLHENHLLSDAVAGPAIGCVFAMTSFDACTTDRELNTIILQVLSTLCNMFPSKALEGLLVAFPDVKSIGMLTMLVSMFRNLFEDDILPKHDYLNLYLTCVAVVVRILVSPRIGEEQKNEFTWFLARIEPISCDVSHRAQDIYPNVISVQARFVPADMMPNYREILEQLYEKSPSYAVNWAGIKDLPLDQYMRLCERVNNPENFSVDQFVAFYDTRVLVDPVATCQYLLGFTKEKTKGFALTRKHPPIEYSRGVLRVMAFMCKVLQEQPAYFEDLMKVAFCKLTTDEVVELRKECRAFIAAFAFNQKFWLKDRAIVYKLLGTPMYIEFCGGLLLKVEKKEETVAEMAVAWMEELAVCDVVKAHNRVIVDGLFNYYGNDTVVEIILNAILGFFETESKWAQLDFLKTIAVMADEQGKRYKLLKLDVVFTPARYLLSDDETLRVTAAEYFLGLFHIPRPEKPDLTKDVEHTANDNDDFLRYYMLPSMPSDKKETFIRIFEKVFDNCDQLFCDRIFKEICQKVTASVGEKIGLHHILMVRALTAKRITFQSHGFKKLVSISSKDIEIFAEATTVICDLACKNVQSFVEFSLTHKMTELLATVIRRISMSVTQRNQLADGYILMLRNSESVTEKNIKYEFLKRLAAADAARENDCYIGKLLMIVLLLLGQQYKSQGSSNTTGLAAIFGSLTNTPGRAIDWDKSIPSLDQFSKAVGSFATIITNIPTEQVEQLFDECRKSIEHIGSEKTVRTVGAFLIHCVHLFSSYGSYNAVRRRNLLGSLLASMFGKGRPVIAYDVTYIFNHTLTLSDIVALDAQQRKNIFTSVLQLMVQMDVAQRTEAADILCFVLPLIDPGSKRIAEELNLSMFVQALQVTMNGIPFTATILNGLEYLARNGVEFRGDPAKTKLSNPSLLYLTCHGKEVMQEKALNIFGIFLKCNHPDETIDAIPRRIPKEEVANVAPRMIEGATVTTIHMPWMKMLCSFAKHLTASRESLAVFYRDFFDLCMKLSANKDHECNYLAMDAIASFA